MIISNAHLKSEYESRFKEFVDQLLIPTYLKTCLLTDETSNGSYIYFLYPKLFIEAFEVNEKEKVDKLCLAGYLTFRSLTYVDKLTDDQIENSNRGMYHQLAMICQEEGIKLLTTLFPIDSVFWEFWNKRKTEYLMAQRMEKKSYEDITLNDFLDIADYKSAFGKVAIDALLFLQSSDEHSNETKTLLNAHRYFSIGRQFYDDLNDIKEDFVSNQANYAFKKLKINLKKEKIEIDSLNENQIETYLYVSGTAKEILQETITHFEMALKLSHSVLSESSLWVKAINTFLIGTRKTLDIQNQYLREVEEQVA